MILVDAHTHLDDKQFENDLFDVIERAKKVGVKEIVTNGINPSSNRKVLEIAKRFDVVKATLGIHPEDINKTNDQEVYAEIEFIKKNKNEIIGIGEVGLDFYWKPFDEKKQKELFQRFIELSEKLKLPIMVHSRKAEVQVIEMLESSKAKPLIHCFGGNMKLTKQVADNGWFISIPCNVVRDDHFQRVVKEINLSNLLTETDAPLLPPRKEERNEPSFVLEAVKKIAEIKGLDIEETANNVYMNYKKLFF